jgi:hypothetical protein
VVFQFARESIGEPRAAPHRGTHAPILTLHHARAHMLRIGVADDALLPTSIPHIENMMQHDRYRSSRAMPERDR